MHVLDHKFSTRESFIPHDAEPLEKMMQYSLFEPYQCESLIEKIKFYSKKCSVW